MKISIIIPVLNERANLPATIASVRAAIPNGEIIAVDGASTDGSLEWLRKQSGIRCLQASRGKGPQQNAGAQVATGDLILFLHADCRLPADAGSQMERLMQDRRVAAGCFFARWSKNSLTLQLIALGMNLRTVARKTCYGDQAIFVRRSVFHQVGGFPDWPLFEDTELIRRAKRAGRFGIIRSAVTMSSRRFEENGILYGIFLVYFLQIGFLLGVSPARLKKWFVDVRPHLKAQGSSDTPRHQVT